MLPCAVLTKVFVSTGSKLFIQLRFHSNAVSKGFADIGDDVLVNLFPTFFAVLYHLGKQFADQFHVSVIIYFSCVPSPHFQQPVILQQAHLSCTSGI